MLRPFFRHSEYRDAWVLRGVGDQLGPVIRVRRTPSGDVFQEPPAKLRLRSKGSARSRPPAGLLGDDPPKQIESPDEDLRYLFHDRDS